MGPPLPVSTRCGVFSFPYRVETRNQERSRRRAARYASTLPCVRRLNGGATGFRAPFVTGWNDRSARSKVDSAAWMKRDSCGRVSAIADEGAAIRRADRVLPLSFGMPGGGVSGRSGADATAGAGTETGAPPISEMDNGTSHVSAIKGATRWSVAVHRSVGTSCDALRQILKLRERSGFCRHFRPCAASLRGSYFSPHQRHAASGFSAHRCLCRHMPM